MGFLRPLVLAVTLILAAAAASAADPVDASIRQLRRAVVPRRDGSHLLLLSSLRQLRDPSLRSFFFQLAQQGSTLIRIHAILGLAEIDESGQVDPWLIRQLDSPEARFSAITQALTQELIDVDHIRKLLEWDDLDSKARGLLLAELAMRDEAVDRAALVRLAEHPNLDIAGPASLVLAQLGESAAMSDYRARLELMPLAGRPRHLIIMFGIVSKYELDNVLDWIVEVIEAPDTNPDVVAVGVATVLSLDAPRGVDLWIAALGNDPPYGKCVRYGLLLLETGRQAPPATFDRLPRDDTLIDGIARAGKAMAGGEDAAGALIALLDLGHRKTTRWAMSAARDLSEDQRSRIYAHLIDRVEGAARGRDERAELAMIATARLFEIDPAAVTKRIEAAGDDSLTQQAMLLGLLESESPAAGDATRRVKRIGYSRADSVALIVISKHADPLSLQEVQQLGVIASGGGRVSEVLQVQAAWLYLKHTAKIEQALAETFATVQAE